MEFWDPPPEFCKKRRDKNKTWLAWPCSGTFLSQGVGSGLPCPEEGGSQWIKTRIRIKIGIPNSPSAALIPLDKRREAQEDAEDTENVI